MADTAVTADTEDMVDTEDTEDTAVIIPIISSNDLSSNQFQKVQI